MALVRNADTIRNTVASLVEQPVSGAVFGYPISALRDYLEKNGHYDERLVGMFELDDQRDTYLLCDYGTDGCQVHHSTGDGIYDKHWHNRVSKAPSKTRYYLKRFLSLDEPPRFTKQLDELTPSARREALCLPRRNAYSERPGDWIIRRYFTSEEGPLVYHSRRIARLTEILVEIRATQTYYQLFQDSQSREMKEDTIKRVSTLTF